MPPKVPPETAQEVTGCEFQIVDWPDFEHLLFVPCVGLLEWSNAVSASRVSDYCPAICIVRASDFPTEYHSLLFQPMHACSEYSCSTEHKGRSPMIAQIWPR